MGKIICDVCGTFYQESVAQCPICGCVRSADPIVVPGDPGSSSVGSGYTYVKGGRFSKANVKKRNNAKRSVSGAGVVPGDEDENKSNNKGLIIAIIVLLLAIVAVVCYIVARFLLPAGEEPAKNTNPVPGVTTAPIETTEAVPATVPCVSLTISDVIVTFDKVGAAQLISATAEPADTTDTVEFSSSDDSVATVNADGKIVAVGPGQAVITVTCGEVQAQCRVNCTFQGEETTEPTTEPTVPVEEFELNRTDFTLSSKGSSWTLYRGDIPSDQITWTSNDEKVATVDKGVVVAVSSGRAIITAEYGGKKLECIVYCSSAVGPYVEPEDNNDDTTEQKKYKLNTDDGRNNDITLRVGESYTLKLLDENGNPLDAVFTCSDESVCELSGGKVTGKEQGTVTVTASYGGEIHNCIVRVR